MKVYIYALHDPRDWSIHYVGKAINPEVRMRKHILQPVNLGMRKFIDELKTVGLVPSLSILQVCSLERWKEWEKFWIITVKKSGAKLVNRGSGGESAQPTSEELRRILSEAHKGLKLSNSAKKKLSLANLGKKLSKQHREKIRKALLGRTISEEARMKSRLAQLGKKISEKTKRKMSLARRGRRCSPETRAKISASLRGHEVTSETRFKISESLWGNFNAKKISH